MVPHLSRPAYAKSAETLFQSSGRGSYVPYYKPGEVGNDIDPYHHIADAEQPKVTVCKGLSCLDALSVQT